MLLSRSGSMESDTPFVTPEAFIAHDADAETPHKSQGSTSNTPAPQQPLQVRCLRLSWRFPIPFPIGQSNPVSTCMLAAKTEERGRNNIHCRSHTISFLQEQCMPGPAAQPERIFASGNNLNESKEAARRPATATEDIIDAAVYHQVMAHLQKDKSKAAQAQQEVAGSHHHAAKMSSAPAEGSGQEEHACGMRDAKEPLSGLMEDKEPAFSLALRSPAVTSEGSGLSGDWEVMLDVLDYESDISSFDDSSVGSPCSSIATATSQMDPASPQDTAPSPSPSASTTTMLASPVVSAMDDSCAGSPVRLAAATVIADDSFCQPSAMESPVAASPSSGATSAIASPRMTVPPNSPALSGISDGALASPAVTAWDVSRTLSFTSPDTQLQQAADCEAAALHNAETASDNRRDAAEEAASHLETDVAVVEAGVGGSEVSALSELPAAVGAPDDLTEAVHPSAGAICKTATGLSSQEVEASMPVLVSSVSPSVLYFNSTITALA